MGKLQFSCRTKRLKPLKLSPACQPDLPLMGMLTWTLVKTLTLGLSMLAQQTWMVTFWLVQRRYVKWGEAIEFYVLYRDS